MKGFIQQMLSWLAAAFLILILGGGFYACGQWKWDECRKVGHGKLYCADKLLGGK